jgi:hypothetical protein
MHKDEYVDTLMRLAASALDEAASAVRYVLCSTFLLATMLIGVRLRIQQKENDKIV